MPYTLKYPGWQVSTRRPRQTPFAPVEAPEGPKTRRVEIRTIPETCRIYVDGRYRAKSPCGVNLLAGDPSMLRIEADGYEPIEWVLPVGSVDLLTFTLEPLVLVPDPDTL